MHLRQKVAATISNRIDTRMKLILDPLNLCSIVAKNVSVYLYFFLSPRRIGGLLRNNSSIGKNKVKEF